MGDDRGGGAELAVDPVDGLEDDDAGLDVEGAGGLVAQDEPGLQDEGAGQGGPLSLASRKLGRAMLEAAAEHKPDVIVADISMPGLNGIDVLRELSGADALPPTIILTTFDDDELVLAGIRSGARGYLLKDVALAELVSAVKTVAEGGSIVKPAVTQRLLKGLENLQTDETQPCEQVGIERCKTCDWAKLTAVAAG